MGKDLHRWGRVVLMFLPVANLGIGNNEKFGTGVNFYIQIDGNISAYYDEVEGEGAKIAAYIKGEPSGIRDLLPRMLTVTGLPLT